MRLPPITPEASAVSRPLARSIHAPSTPTSYVAFRLFYGDEPPTLSIKDQVAVAVAERIIEGRFAPGERIPEQLLADEFNVSKAPVSEALILLEYVGLVESAARRSAYVPRLSAEDFDELTEYRTAIARIALARLFERPQASRRELFDGYLVEMEKIAGDDARSFEFVEIFDRAMLLAAAQGGHHRITRALFVLSLQVLRYYRLCSQTAKQRRALLGLWRQASAALEARDRQTYTARLEEIQRLRYAECVAALKAAA